MTETQDFPFDKVITKANEFVAMGHTVHQKFTCSGCGARLTLEEPNTFYTSGCCDKCPVITDIVAQGCNYLIIMNNKKFEIT